MLDRCLGVYISLELSDLVFDKATAHELEILRLSFLTFDRDSNPISQFLLYSILSKGSDHLGLSDLA